MDQRNVLVVEDDESMRSAVAYCLQKSGYTVFVSGDGQQALARLRENDISLVILDLALPYLNGLDLLERLNTEFQPGAIAAIVLTAFADEENRHRSFELGAKRFIVKPFRLREVALAAREVMDAMETGE